MSNQEGQRLTTLRSQSFHRSDHLDEKLSPPLNHFANETSIPTAHGQITTSIHRQISVVINSRTSITKPTSLHSLALIHSEDSRNQVA